MSDLDTSVLFRPFRLKTLELKNRIVMAPMTRNAAPNGIPGEANVAYYRRRAEGGVGLILTSGNVSRITFGELGNPTLIVLGLPN